MRQKAWVHQVKSQVAKYGDKASWYCSWRDPEGLLRTKSCGPGKIGKTAAKNLADKTHAELVTGTYRSKVKQSCEDLRAKYNTKIASRLEGPSRMAAEMALNNFERVAKPNILTAITTEFIDSYIAKRLEEFAQRTGKPERSAGKQLLKISPATINKELRYVRAILNIAKEWGMVSTVPKIRFLKTAKLLPTFIPQDCFAAIYAATDTATRPSQVPNVSPALWWRGLLVMGYMTGWRIGQLLSLKLADVDLNSGTAITRADVIGNKGKREERIPLHQIVIEHLRLLAASFDQFVFPWNENLRNLWPEFQAIQQAARMPDKSPLPELGKRGGWFAFHDLRRSFATMNAASMNLFELQGLMQHRSLETTKLYVNMAKRYDDTVKNLYVPDNLRIAETG